jgi:septum formation topological specificity factor MinE
MNLRADMLDPEGQSRLEALRDRLDLLAAEVRSYGLEIAARLLEAARKDISERIKMERPCDPQRKVRIG